MALPKIESADRAAVIDTFLKENNIKVNIHSSNLRRIPEDGPGIALVNGLFGSVDPLLVIQALTKFRSDVVVLTSYDFSSAKELQGVADNLDLTRSENEIKIQIEQHLNLERLVVLFPARKGTITKFTANLALDKRWDPKLLRVLYALDFPIYPMFMRTDSIVHLLHSKSFSFDRMTAFFKDLSDSEKEVSVRIGKEMSPKVKKRFKDADGYSRYLRAKLYALGSPLDVGSFFFKRKKKKEKLEPNLTGLSIDSSILEKELTELPEKCLVLQQAQFSVYLAPTTDIPITIKEIGRLREITFREVGEGTGRDHDLDEYDMYYHQLVLWDHERKRIAGGYRIGFGNEIMDLHGKRGFYLHSLFKLRKPFKPVLEQSLELGRSYITSEYQKTRLPLFLLWKAILAVLLNNRQFRYLIGPVSISNDYSSLSRELIVGFIRKNYWNYELAELIKPRKAFRPKIKDVDVDALLQGVSDEMRDLDKMIEDIEPERFKVPVLIKKYLKQDARIIGFNLDPKFSDALDGLMVLDLKDIPQETLENLNRDLS